MINPLDKENLLSFISPKHVADPHYLDNDPSRNYMEKVGRCPPHLSSLGITIPTTECVEDGVLPILSMSTLAAQFTYAIDPHRAFVT